MDQLRYIRSLADLIGLEISPRANVLDAADHLFGLFQCFMPDGDGVEQVFAPLPHGDELLRRLHPIYAASATHFSQNDGAVPGYFVPAEPAFPAAKTRQLGTDLLRGMRDFAEFWEDEDLLEALSRVTIVEMRAEAPDADPVWESWREQLSNWRIDSTDHDSLVATLGEAFYSIACDYTLATYFQYPTYASRPDGDPLLPYFHLWLAGFTVGMDGQVLVLARR